MSDFNYYWHYKGPRQGDRCRLLNWIRRCVNGARSEVVVEFEDGERVECVRNAVRKIKGGVDAVQA